MIADAVHTAQLIIWGAAISFGLLTASVAGLAITAGTAAGNAIARRHHLRRAIRDIELIANHPGARALLDDIRKENES